VAQKTKVIIAVLNGPNLNLLGEREPEIYGHARLADIERATQERARALGVECSWVQTNHEGELVEAIQGLKGRADGAVINAAAFTHTSLAVRDALLAVRVPFVEVHLSNIFGREPERRKSLLADLAVGVVTGFGAESYRLGLEGLVSYLGRR
jgi:3-dehydroquinate dehydratase-2